ncbi:hypothetical protein [Archaeoglobus veneficus]|uniref:Uncharacterized protein n=1 Tax=Archaeoglobus veneficus (strain DSM 11195 / SNP6) TaxID=693661 RepID=F2KSH8_ARCVS|nr:hypothetical protein [Archaeoglobus veneficus]AEA48048.1 hypothetical protein Arcve_2058 [Archaeoglobus veneficus SNP6]
MITSNLHYRIHFFKKAAREAGLNGKLKITDIDNVITVNGRIRAVMEFKEKERHFTLYALPEFQYKTLRETANTLNADLILLFFDFEKEQYWLCHYKAGKIPVKEARYTKNGWFVFFGKGEGRFMTHNELFQYFVKLLKEWKHEA